MLIRPVSPENLGNFIEAAGPPEHYEEVDHCLRHMFSAGSMRPEWCFMAEEGDYAAVGRRLLSHAHDAARALGAEDIEHIIDAPPMRPQFQHHARKWIDLLKSTGFYLRRETGRYKWSGTEPPTETCCLLSATPSSYRARVLLNARSGRCRCQIHRLGF
jgi:hypothetical protein